MKPIFEKIRDAANDEQLNDAAFRQIIRQTFANRQHDETILMAFLRAEDIVKTQTADL